MSTTRVAASMKRRRADRFPLPVPRLATVLVALAVGFGLVGAVDRPAAEAGAMTAREAYLRGGFDPARGEAPFSCRAAGLQFVASSSDGAPWVHTCLDAFLRPPSDQVVPWP